MLYLCICVFCICIFVIASLTHGNIIFDIPEQSSFQKYATCWVFLALCHMLYLCICAFVFMYLRIWHMGVSFLIPLNNPLFKNIPHVGSFWHFAICRICVFVYLCNWIFVFARLTLGLVYHFWYPWTILFSKYTTCWVLLALRNMLYLCICVFVYLCICICVFVYETLGNISFDILGPRVFRKCMVCMV